MNNIIVLLKKYKLKNVKAKGSSCPGGTPYVPVRVNFGS